MSNTKYKGFTDNNRAYYRTVLATFLNSMEINKEHLTLEFYGYYRLNEDEMRKALRTLEFDGMIENINHGFNWHRWKLTEKGIEWQAWYRDNPNKTKYYNFGKQF